MNRLKECPLCGSKAFIAHIGVNGLDFGWSVGCPKARIDDPVHKLGEEELKKARIVMHGFASKENAIKAWNRRVEE